MTSHDRGRAITAAAFLGGFLAALALQHGLLVADTHAAPSAAEAPSSCRIPSAQIVQPSPGPAGRPVAL